MSDHLLTRIRVRDVAYMETGRKQAFRILVATHDCIGRRFWHFIKFEYFPRCVRSEYHDFNDDIDAFIETLNIRIVEERPEIVIRRDGYHIDVDYLIEVE